MRAESEGKRDIHVGTWGHEDGGTGKGEGHTLVSLRALMVAVRVQLYRMASSPKSLPTPITPLGSPFLVTSTSPSDFVCVCV